MDLTLNEAQRIVLQWVADGADLNNPLRRLGDSCAAD